MFAPVPERADAALRVHRGLGPGLLESVYEHCLVFEPTKADFALERQAILPVLHDGMELKAGYRVDLIVDESLIVQIKAVEALSPLHEAQVLTYLKLSGLRLGLLINFNVLLLKHGIRRFVL